MRMVPQIVAPERDTGFTGNPDNPVGDDRVALAAMVQVQVGRCDVPGRADRHIAERHDAWTRDLGLGQLELPTRDRHLRPLQPADFLLTHAGLCQEADHPARHRGGLGNPPINLFGGWIGRPLCQLPQYVSC